MNILHLKPAQDNNSNNMPATKKASSNQECLQASGDGNSPHCCRLCGGDFNLKYFMETYVCQGAEERYDQLLYNCFGVKVTSPDCMICEWCVSGLKRMEKLRTLVHAAFAEDSDGNVPSSVSSMDKTVIASSCQTAHATIMLKQACRKQLRKKSIEITKGQAKMTPEPKNRRINVQCEYCRQKYPIFTLNGQCKSFICSRCKKNREQKSDENKRNNNIMPSTTTEHLLRTGPKLHKKQVTQNNAMLPKKKFQCTKCPKMFSIINDMSSHVKNCHGDSKNISLCDESARRGSQNIMNSNKTPTEFELIFKNHRAISLLQNASTLK